MRSKKTNPVAMTFSSGLRPLSGKENTSNFIKIYFMPIVIVLLIFILGVSLYGSRVNKESFDMPDTSAMEKPNSQDVTARPISNSDIVKIITEFITKINNHDVILQSLDKTYTKNKINISSDAENMKENINRMLIVMKKQDAEIQKLFTSDRFKKSLPPYIPSPDLQGLIDGTLLADKEKRLYNLSHYPLSPNECSLDVIQQKIIDLSNNLADAKAKSTKTEGQIDVTVSAIEGELNMKKSDMESLKQNLKNPNFIKCHPTLSIKDATSTVNGLYLTSISSILVIQDDAINMLQKHAGEIIVNSYSQLYNVTTKPEE